MSFKTIFPFSGRFSFSVAGVFAVSLVLLLIPLTAMQFTDAVQWSAGDFLIMGFLLNGAGLLAIALLRDKRFLTRLAGICTVISVFLLVWVNLAVGLVGSGPHWGQPVVYCCSGHGVGRNIYFAIQHQGNDVYPVYSHRYADIYCPGAALGRYGAFTIRFAHGNYWCEQFFCSTFFDVGLAFQASP
ncbi:MAG: hypothetical protein KatS3mg032_0242 [Cyclobacteriaceae bacterium]|nr:MAG: hypothetical protein KatS3mg032_0242 [Cyclobacteriaceae bacterium]